APADDGEEALVVDGSEVARPQPTAAQRLGGGVRPLEVAKEDVLALQGEFPDLARVAQRTVGAPDGRLGVEHRFADRAGPELGLVEGDREAVHARLGEAVALTEAHAAGREGGADRFGAGRATRD